MNKNNDQPENRENTPDNTPNNDTPPSDIWYTIEELMAKFKRSKSTINRWRREKGLVCCEVESVVLVNKIDLDKFFWRHRNNKLLVLAFLLWQNFMQDIFQLCDAV